MVCIGRLTSHQLHVGSARYSDKGMIQDDTGWYNSSTGYPVVYRDGLQGTVLNRGLQGYSVGCRGIWCCTTRS